MNVLEAQDVSYKYASGTLALQNLNLSVQEGSVYGLLGRNGSGKSTLIKLFMALMHVTNGKVNVFGLDPWSDHEGIKSRIGYISEDQMLPQYLKVNEIFSFYAECYKDWDQNMAENLRNKFKLEPNKRITQLSKGQQRQVGLICAVSHHPELLILDEPGGGLDAVARRELLEMIIELLHQKGSTVMFSSHHLQDVERIADQIGILNEGKLLLETSVDDIHENYCQVILETDYPNFESILRDIPECFSIKKTGDAYTIIFSTNLDKAKVITDKYLESPTKFQGTQLNLEDAFITLVGDVG
ncbi:MAG: ABC transporter ATP-binding protein [Planctomycetota bacterium]|nr:MAG: ABC transporter ATP-binding protein [Planctomycetota bacterium]